MDANGGGVVLFDEFCVWYTKKINPEREIATCTSQFVDKRSRKKRKKSLSKVATSKDKQVKQVKVDNLSFL